MKSASQTITIDENHPFFLHHGENLGAILVSQPLVSEIYPTWAKSMKRALSAKNKLGFIDGTLTLAPTMVKSPLLVQAWTRCNNMVVSWILNSVSPKILASVIYRDTTLEVWKDVKERFSQGNGQRIFQLQNIWLELIKGSSQSQIISLN